VDRERNQSVRDKLGVQNVVRRIQQYVLTKVATTLTENGRKQDLQLGTAVQTRWKEKHMTTVDKTQVPTSLWVLRNWPYTKQSLHQTGPTPNRPYTKQALHQTGPTPNRPHTKQALHQTSPTPNRPYAKQALHQTGPTPNRPYTKQALHQTGPTPNRPYTKQALYQTGPTPNRCRLF